MTQQSDENSTKRFVELSGRYILQGLLIALLFIGLGVFILTYQADRVDVIDLELGQVAARDVLAPQQFSYISEVETQLATERAQNGVATIYSPPDPKVARDQVEHLGQVFDFLEAIRADPYGSLAQKSEWIAAIPNLSLSDAVVGQVLTIGEEAWSETRQEARAILNQAMRDELRDSQVLATRRRLPTLVELDTPSDQRDIIVAITEDLIKPNTFPDETGTEAERQAQIAEIEPIEVTIEANEKIISAGERVRQDDLEKLIALQTLQEPEFNRPEDFVAPVVLMVMITVVIGTYLFQYALRILVDSKRLILLILLLLTFIATAKYVIPQGTFFHLYPIAALTMIMVVLIDTQLAFISTVLLALLAGYMATDNIQEVIVYLILSGVGRSLSLR